MSLNPRRKNNRCNTTSSCCSSLLAVLIAMFTILLSLTYTATEVGAFSTQYYHNKIDKMNSRLKLPSFPNSNNNDELQQIQQEELQTLRNIASRMEEVAKELESISSSIKNRQLDNNSNGNDESNRSPSQEQPSYSDDKPSRFSKIPSTPTFSSYYAQRKQRELEEVERMNNNGNQNLEIPRLTNLDLEELSKNGYVVIRNFLSDKLVSELQKDLSLLRMNDKFKRAKIGQGDDNEQNENVRIAETCFLGAHKEDELSVQTPSSQTRTTRATMITKNKQKKIEKIPPTPTRKLLYETMDMMCQDLSKNPILGLSSSYNPSKITPLSSSFSVSNVNRILVDDAKDTNVKDLLSVTPKFYGPELDPGFIELLYVYYPQGGYYKRHVDSVPYTLAHLRTYSLLLYLNSDWERGDGGFLRIYPPVNGGGRKRQTNNFQDDETELNPPDSSRDYVLDVSPKAGTLVLFKSDLIPHEVLNTYSERMGVVGWFNRPIEGEDPSMIGWSR